VSSVDETKIFCPSPATTEAEDADINVSAEAELVTVFRRRDEVSLAGNATGLEVQLLVLIEATGASGSSDGGGAVAEARLADGPGSAIGIEIEPGPPSGAAGAAGRDDTCGIDGTDGMNGVNPGAGGLFLATS
jgi:hypothetical protein